MQIRFKGLLTIFLSIIIVQSPEIARSQITEHEDESKTWLHLATLDTHQGSVTVLTFSSDGNFLASGGTDHTIKIWRMYDWQEIASLTGHTGEITTLAFSVDHSLLASGGSDGHVKLWKYGSWEEHVDLGGVGPVIELNFGKLLRAITADLWLIEWEPSPWRKKQSIHLVKQFSVNKTSWLGGRFQVYPKRFLAFSPDGNLISLLNKDDDVLMCDLTDWEEICHFHTEPYNDISSSAISPVGTSMAYSVLDSKNVPTIHIFDCMNQSTVAKLAGHEASVTALTFSPDGKLLVSGSADNKAKVWAVSDGTELATLAQHNGQILALAFHPEKSFFASGASDNKIMIWGTESAKRHIASITENDESTVMLRSNPAFSFLLEDVNETIPQTKMDNPDAIAVVIGNEDYARNVPDVDCAIDDAIATKRHLINVLGYRDYNIMFIENATLADLRSIFGEENTSKGKLYNAIKPQRSDVFVYYSGHGVKDDETDAVYILPVDCEQSQVKINAYPFETLYRNISELDARWITVVIDACYLAPEGKKGPAIVVNDPAIYFLKEKGALFTSTDNKHPSYWIRGMNHSLYTYFFLLALQGRADYNGDGKLTVDEINMYVSNPADGVPYYSGRLKDEKQNPCMYTVRNLKVLVEY